MKPTKSGKKQILVWSKNIPSAFHFKANYSWLLDLQKIGQRRGKIANSGRYFGGTCLVTGYVPHYKEKKYD